MIWGKGGQHNNSNTKSEEEAYEELKVKVILHLLIRIVLNKVHSINQLTH